jgi:Mg2+ and Co2+ transporter CorA
MNNEIIGLDLICNRTYGRNLNIKNNDNDDILSNDETKQDIFDLIQTRLDDSTVPNTKNKILYNLVDSLIHAINLILEDN